MGSVVQRERALSGVLGSRPGLLRKKTNLKIDIVLQPSSDLRADAERIIQARTWGFDAAWSVEWRSNPFFPLTIAAKGTQGPFTLGAMAAQAIARSPMISAQIAWDLARQSGGRFVLGLDAEMPQFHPAGQGGQALDSVGLMREYLESLRAIWRTFQYDERLRFRGRHYQFRLMAPFFNPGPITRPEIPIFLSGGGGGAVYALAGEQCQGLHANLLHSQPYLRDVILPHLARGLESSGRARDSCELAVPVLVCAPDMMEKEYESRKDTGKETEMEIARYALSRSNRSFAEYHGWEENLETLRATVHSGDSGAIWRSVPEDILREIAIVAEPQRAAAAIRQRYSDLADRVCLVFADWNPEAIAAIVADLKEQSQGQQTDQA